MGYPYGKDEGDEDMPISACLFYIVGLKTFAAKLKCKLDI